MKRAMKLKEINHIGFVVRDVDKITEQFWKKFGIGPWAFIEFGPNVKNSTYHGEPCCNLMKIAEARVGPISLELIQPVSGLSPHMDFLQTMGEGLQHLGFMIDNPQEAGEMKSLGYSTICSAEGIADIKDSYAAYFDTDKDIACVLELGCYSGDGSEIEVYKIYPDPEADLSDQEPPMIIDNISLIGFVVGDAERSAEYFWKNFGIGPWAFFELGPGLDKTECYGHSCEFSFKIATAQLGALKLELIQPLSGQTPHMEFLQTRGGGLFHLGTVIDSQEQLAMMKKLGYKEITSAYGIGGKEGYGVYYDTMEDLGVILELIHFDAPPAFYKIYPETGEEK